MVGLAKSKQHGHAIAGHRSPTYHCWLDMRRRCYNPKTKDFVNYGARGIKVCTEWLLSFAAFLRDMGELPDGKTIDRINNDGDYCLANCRWATRAQQNWTRRPTKLLTFRGQTKPMTVWNRELGFGGGTIRRRLLNGMSISEALTLPNMRTRKMLRACAAQSKRRRK